MESPFERIGAEIKAPNYPAERVDGLFKEIGEAGKLEMIFRYIEKYGTPIYRDTEPKEAVHRRVIDSLDVEDLKHYRQMIDSGVEVQPENLPLSELVDDRLNRIREALSAEEFEALAKAE